jgi:hypothetical protein
LNRQVRRFEPERLASIADAGDFPGSCIARGNKPLAAWLPAALRPWARRSPCYAFRLLDRLLLKDASPLPLRLTPPAKDRPSQDTHAGVSPPAPLL